MPKPDNHLVNFSFRFILGGKTRKNHCVFSRELNPNAMINTYWTRLLALAGLLVSAPCILAQEVFYNPHTQEEITLVEGTVSVPTPTDFYMRSDPLMVVLESDFSHLQEHKTERDYQDAVLHVRLSDSISMRCTVRIKARGHSRLDFCDQPPLKIDFSESGLAASSLKNLRKVKLVSNCKQGFYYDKYVFREFLAYKLFNQLTPKSFRVRLAQITFIDSGNNGKSWENYGFIIEETDALARREQLLEVEEQSDALLFDRNCLHMLSMFQFMISNTDWHLPSLHNLKFFKDTAQAQQVLHVVPYDFDLSGLVQSIYAQPRKELNQEHVKERIFICNPMEEADLNELIELFKSRKPYFYQTIEEFPYLSKGDKKTAQKYLDDFYKILDHPKKREKYLVENVFPYDW